MLVAVLPLLAASLVVLVAILVHSSPALMANECPHPLGQPPRPPAVTASIADRTAIFREVFPYFVCGEF